MTFLETLNTVLPHADRSIVVGVQLEHRISLHGGEERINLIMLTDRAMTLRGGDGHDGVDGGAIACLREAARSILSRGGKLERIDEIVIRQRDCNLSLDDI